MRNKPTKQQLINFSKRIGDFWEAAKIHYPVHLSGGNEDQLIDIFSQIKEGDYVFSTHRSHYHYLLVGGSETELEKMILRGDSMHVFDKKLNFLTSSILSGSSTIAAGVALALKKQKSQRHVWCFVGDGTEDEGHFYEAVRYVYGHQLPCTFVIEDNNRSVDTPKEARYSKSIEWPASCVMRYHYKPTYPHIGTGKWISFSGHKTGGNSF
jgi:pyruvate dehydrogenase E1 component alpha subunit